MISLSLDFDCSICRSVKLQVIVFPLCSLNTQYRVLKKFRVIP